MRVFRFFLLALLVAFSSTAYAVASVHKCCDAPACDIGHCIDLGCAPAPPAVAFNKPLPAPIPRAGALYAAPLLPSLPDPNHVVWTPPD